MIFYFILMTIQELCKNKVSSCDFSVPQNHIRFQARRIMILSALSITYGLTALKIWEQHRDNGVQTKRYFNNNYYFLLSKI